MRQFFGEINWEKKALVFFGALLLLVVVGPFGTYGDLPLARRFVFWSILMIGVGFFMHVCMNAALNSRHLSRLNRFARLFIGSAIAAVPSAAIVAFVEELFRGSPTTMSFLRLAWFQITLIGFAIGTVEYVDWTPPRPALPDPAPALVRTPFHDRLTRTLGEDIISLSMQDHYVEVTTTVGRELILIRMKDAMQEIEDLPGQRIHRSHWVAARHVRDVARDGPRHLVTLSDGRKLPVSATYAKATQALLA